jgi:hypothetical protein
MSNKPLLIGLSDKAGSGKSTVADYLTGAHGYQQFAFADVLKEVVQTAFHFSDEQMRGGKEFIDPRFEKSPRWCLQYFGTAFRAVWPEIWIWNLRSKILDFLALNGQHPIVITDVRFRDEAEALKRLGAVLVRIERGKDHRLKTCATGIPGHISETDLDGWAGWDMVIRNNGSLSELGICLEGMLPALTPKEPPAGNLCN